MRLLLGIARFLIVTLFSGLAVLISSTLPHKAVALDLAATTSDRQVAIKLYEAAGDGKRPAVIIIHGAQGIGKFAAEYRRYATTLAGFGIDAYLPSYYDADDEHAVNAPDQAARRAWLVAHFDQWADAIKSVADLAAHGPKSSGRVGLLGFSNGTNIGSFVAATDSNITAFVAFYGGIPKGHASKMEHLPPTLELHGDADSDVPIAEGAALVEFARRAGARAEQVVYPGERHAFDFQSGRIASGDAMGRTLAWFGRELDVP